MILVMGLFGGLGLFFVGVKLLGSNLRQMTGQRFRRLVEGATRHPVPAALLGCASGAVTQSTSAMTFIVVALSSAGVVDPRRAIPLLVWANVGTAALVLVATLDTHGPVLFVLGVTGLSFFADLHASAKWRHGLFALLGAGLLFLGLTLMKDSAGPLQDMPAVCKAIATAASYPFLGLAAGALLAVLAQSSATVSVIAVTLVNAGLLSMEQAAMVIYGAGLGSGLAVGLLSSNSRGLAGQLVLLQVLCKGVGALVLVPLFFIERALDVPLALALVQTLAETPAGQAAVLFLLYQLVAAGLVSVVQGPVFGLVQRLSPPTPADSLSRPRYLFADGLEEPESALDLVDREQARVVSVAIAVLDSQREDAAADPETSTLPRPALVEAGSALAGEIHRYLDRLMDRGPRPETLERAVRAQNRLLLTTDLITAVVDLVTVIETVPPSATLATFNHALVESLHLALDLLRDELLSSDQSGVETVIALTADRSDMMERRRRSLLKMQDNETPAVMDAVLLSTSQFERAVWLVNRCARLLREDHEGSDPGQHPVAA